jgi:hypothetical protein
VDASERLAALLAGELDADERIALEAELARDPELRASLAAMERADLRLREVSSPRPSEGFDQRLDAVLANTLDEVLGTENVTAREGSTAAGATGDVFTAKRRERASRRTHALIGVAAAAVVVVGTGALLGTFGDDDRGDDASSMIETMDADDADDAGDDAASEDLTLALDGPIVVAEGRSLDNGDLDDLLAGGELGSVRSQGFDDTLGRGVAERFQAELGARSLRSGAAAEQELDRDEAGDVPQEESAPTDDSEMADDADTDADGTGGAELVTRDGVPVPGEAAADIARCLDEVLGADGDAIPAYTELATYEDDEVVVFGMITVDPDTGTFSRNEVWVLERTTCDVLRFSQG